jgi:hypothetical protein
MGAGKSMGRTDPNLALTLGGGGGSQPMLNNLGIGAPQYHSPTPLQAAPQQNNWQQFLQMFGGGGGALRPRAMQ